MKTKLAYFSLLSALIPITSIAALSSFAGPVGSVNLGIIQGQAKVNQVLQADIVQVITTLDFISQSGMPTKVTDQSFLGGISLGYGWSLNSCFVLGIELRANFDSLQPVLNPTLLENTGGLAVPMQTSIKMRQQYGLLAKIGFATDPQTQFYGLVGPQWGTFKTASSATFQWQPAIDIFSGSIGASQSNTRCGYLLGLGVEHFVADCITIGFEYNYANYGSIGFPSSTGTITSNGTPPTSTIFSNGETIHFSSNTTMLRLNYYF